jgi:hypothetical protein
MDIIQDVLIYQTQMMRNSSLGPYVPADFSPPEYIVVVNALFYGSLGVMLLAAFIAMLIKSWVREFDRGLRALSIPEQRAKTREFRYLGMERWKLPEMVGVLPFLIQISLFLFSIGLVLFLFHVSKPSFGVTTAILGVGVLYNAITTSISVFVTSSPFHSPLSRKLAMVYRHVHAHLCPRIGDFVSGDMITIPATALGHSRRRVQIFLQMLRPYLESDFVEPVAATTIDEVQLSTAASALQRFHDGTPNSQHSEALHWSVWQVAGSASLRIPPLFNLPSWILNRGSDEEYISHLPPAMLVALGAVSLRTPRIWHLRRFTTVRAALQRMGSSKVPWAQLVFAVLDRLLDDLDGLDDLFDLPENLDNNLDDLFDNHLGHHLDFFLNYLDSYNMRISVRNKHTRHTKSNDLINMIRRKELSIDESLWLLSTLSELRSGGWLSPRPPSWIGICLAMLLNHAPKRYYFNHANVVLLEAVVTLAAISCSPDRTNRQIILTNSRKQPWLLLNLRNPGLIGTMFEATPSDYHKQLVSLLFLVLYGLIYKGSIPLAVQYFTTITAKGDLPLYTSALTTIAPSISNDGLAALGRMLVAPPTRDLTPIIDDSLYFKQRAVQVQEELLKNYDHHLGASGNPDRNIVAILLMLSKDLPSEKLQQLQDLDLELQNPWLRLVARVVAQLDIPDGSGLPMGLFYDHKVHNIAAALSLLRYTEGKVTQYTESLLLASFLESRELSISSVTLKYYMRATISYSDPSAPACYLSRAVQATFNHILPDNHLWVGWEILEIFVNGFENLPVEWRRTFAEAFFTVSRRPLSLSQGGKEMNTPEKELKQILTWEYFHKEEQEPELTDLEFSGLDWMAMAWSLHLLQQSRRNTEGSGRGKAQSQELSELMVNEEFVLGALCKLLDAAPYYRITPIIPKLCEFVQWFDNVEPYECRSMISTRIEEAVRRQQEFQEFHKFHKFHCMWYI